MTDYSELVNDLRHADDLTADHKLLGVCARAADAIEAFVKRVNLSELKIKEYKGEADLYRDLYRSAHEVFVKELYGKHGTIANLQSLKQSPIPYNLCPNRAQDVYNLCANYPEKPDISESPNS